MARAIKLIQTNTNLSNNSSFHETAFYTPPCYVYPGIEQSFSLTFEPNDIAYHYRAFTRAILQNSEVINTILKKFDIVNVKPFIEFYIPDTPCFQEFKTLKTLAENIISSLMQVKNADKILQLLVNYDASICYHSLEVMCHSMVMGHFLNYSKELISELSIAALTHNIGTIFIPHNLPESSNVNEMAQKIKQIPLYSAALIKKSILATPEILSAITSHQENFIGTGYPFGKMGSEISPLGMIIHLADDFDTLYTNKRTWEHRGSLDYLYKYINKMKFRRYSSATVDAFNASIEHCLM